MSQEMKETAANKGNELSAAKEKLQRKMEELEDAKNAS